MKRVYLDQNKWIDFARARTGHPQGEQFRDAYHAALSAADASQVSFPLSAAHYFETQRQGSSRRREELADTMLLLSKLTTLAPPHMIVPWEIETALIEVFGLENPTPPPIDLYGVGAAHAFATELATYAAPTEVNGVSLSVEQHALMTLVGRAIAERSMLSGNGGPDDVRSTVAAHGRRTGDRFVAGQELVRDQLGILGRHRLNDVMTGTALGDIATPVIGACRRLGIDPNDVFGASRETLEKLVFAMPSRWVEQELRRARQSNPQQPWASNDLNDITALAIIIPYCDVVITERQWVGVITTRKINHRFGTTMLRDVRELSYDA